MPVCVCVRPLSERRRVVPLRIYGRTPYDTFTEDSDPFPEDENSVILEDEELPLSHRYRLVVAHAVRRERSIGARKRSERRTYVSIYTNDSVDGCKTRDKERVLDKVLEGYGAGI